MNDKDLNKIVDETKTPNEQEQESKKNKTGFLVKIMCVLLAFLLWLYVAGDQTFERTFEDVPVKVEDEDVLKAAGLEAISNSESVADITVSGKRSVVNSLKAEDFYAYISLKGINTSQQYMLPIKVDAPAGVSVSKAQPESVNVYIDRINLRNFPVASEIVGGGVKGEETEDITVKLEVNEVTVEGPGEIISRINKAVAEIDLGGVIETSKDVVGNIKLCDADGNVVESEYISVTPGSVKAHVPVYYTKTVSVVPNFENDDGEITDTADNYSYVVSVPKLTLKSESEEILTAVEKIYTKPISLSSVPKGSAKYELDIPEGVIVDAGISSVEIEISDNSSAEVELNNIVFVNLDNSLKVSHSDESVKVKFTGDASQLINLTSSDYYCVADLSKVTKPDVYEIGVSVARSPASGIDDGKVYVEGTYKISVAVSANEKDAAAEKTK